jgi:hypothetical protein
MQIDWPWRAVPEVRDLPRAEQKRLWRLGSTRSMRSWQFVASMALEFAVLWIMFFWGFVILSLFREAGIQSLWLDVIKFLVYLPAFAIGSTLAFQPWIKATRREIQHELERIHASRGHSYQDD